MQELTETAVQPEPHIDYPESDGQPMADNTRQFRWIVLIKENLEVLFQDRDDVFVAGDLLWYPVKGQPAICRAPDAMVVFGRPRGDRGSYRQWEEGDLAPQVVFEVLSPQNSFKEMLAKLAFYDEYGVEEYYVYDPEPERNDLTGFRREEGQLRLLEDMQDWVSPRLGIRFDMSGAELRIFRPDGEPFRSHQELAQLIAQARQQAAQAEQRVAASEERAARLAEKLRELGIEPE
jgi:Uma2 family endonuclease